jgi:hypothetical protein
VSTPQPAWVAGNPPTVGVGRHEQRGDEPARVVDHEDPADLSGRRVVEGDQDQSEGLG